MSLEFSILLGGLFGWAIAPLIWEIGLLVGHHFFPRKQATGPITTFYAEEFSKSFEAKT